MKTTQIITALETLERKTLLTNETKEAQPEPTGCVDQLMCCWGWVMKWHYVPVIFDSTKKRVLVIDIEDDTPDAAPATKPGKSV